MKKIVMFLFFVSVKAQSPFQTEIERVLISSYSLSYYTLFTNGEVAFVEYDRESPIMATEKRRKSGIRRVMCGTIGYVVASNGYGKFKKSNDSLYVYFSENPAREFKIEKRFVKTEKNQDTITVAITPKHEIIGYDDDFLDISVSSEDRKIYADNFRFADQSKPSKLKFAKNQLPIKLRVNGWTELAIDDFLNQEITFYLNPHKVIYAPIKHSKSVALSSLFFAPE